MNPKWPVWIKASIAKHIEDIVKDYGDIYLEGSDDDKQAVFPRFEIRVDGPDVIETGKTIKLLVYINILIISRRGANAFSHEALIGQGLLALENDIVIKKYATGDDNSVAFCMQPNNRIETLNYGELDKSQDIIQSTVEREYTILT